jgi:hypothetical protein
LEGLVFLHVPEIEIASPSFREGQSGGATVRTSLLAGTGVVGSTQSICLDVQPKMDLLSHFSALERILVCL